MTKFAIIGTAGRDKAKPMTRKTWDWMLRTAMEQIPPDSHLVSGGAAWSDHIAVALFLMDYAAELTTFSTPLSCKNTASTHQKHPPPKTRYK